MTLRRGESRAVVEEYDHAPPSVAALVCLRLVDYGCWAVGAVAHVLVVLLLHVAAIALWALARAAEGIVAAEAGLGGGRAKLPRALLRPVDNARKLLP